LARGEYGGAFQRTEHDPYYWWTPELIRAVVQGYGLPEPHRSGRVFTVTPRKSTHGGPPRRTVDREEIRPHAMAEVWYDLPLNGEWSDLTATFRIEPRDDGSVVVLQEIRVFFEAMTANERRGVDAGRSNLFAFWRHWPAATHRDC
jgi:hypothetical protein